METSIKMAFTKYLTMIASIIFGLGAFLFLFKSDFHNFYLSMIVASLWFIISLIEEIIELIKKNE